MSDDPGGQAARVAMRSRGLSLHIGVNHVDPGHYRGWEGTLTSCENDADTMLGIARASGFEASQLKTAEATRDGVAQAVRAAAGELAEGDIYLLTYAGHGGQVRDLDGDEADGKDDTWCLYDGQLLDDELNVLFAGFRPGVRVLVFSDSCHSGTMLKGGGQRPTPPSGVVDDFVHSRQMPRQAAIDTQKANRSFYAAIQQALPRPHPRIHATVRLLSGCQENQESFGNATTGRFTAAVKQVFDNGAFRGDYEAFYSQLVKTVALAMHPQTPNHVVIGAPNRVYDRQVPFTI